MCKRNIFYATFVVNFSGGKNIFVPICTFGNTASLRYLEVGMTDCVEGYATCNENEFNCNYIIAIYFHEKRRIGVIRSCNR